MALPRASRAAVLAWLALHLLVWLAAGAPKARRARLNDLPALHRLLRERLADDPAFDGPPGVRAYRRLKLRASCWFDLLRGWASGRVAHVNHEAVIIWTGGAAARGTGRFLLLAVLAAIVAAGSACAAALLLHLLDRPRARPWLVAAGAAFFALVLADAAHSIRQKRPAAAAPPASADGHGDGDGDGDGAEPSVAAAPPVPRGAVLVRLAASRVPRRRPLLREHIADLNGGSTTLWSHTTNPVNVEKAHRDGADAWRADSRLGPPRWRLRISVGD